MADFRNFYSVLKHAFFAFVICTLSLFSFDNFAFAGEEPSSFGLIIVSDPDKPFYFSLAATGTFYVNCGGGTLEIHGEEDGITMAPFSEGVIEIVSGTTDPRRFGCSYDGNGKKNIYFGGTATSYNGEYQNAAISFYDEEYQENTANIDTISGDLSAIFPYNVENETHPTFYKTFYGASNARAIPSTLFSEYTVGTSHMFASTFEGCSTVTTLPDELFSNIVIGAENMFESTFKNCTGLTALPDALFSKVETGADNMFESTFAGCSTMKGTVPATLFENLIENKSDATELMKGIFDGTALETSCPEDYYQFETGYEEYWDIGEGKKAVMCESCPEGTQSEAGSVGSGACYTTNMVYYPFSITTTNLSAGATFTFTISARGTFYIDCGSGGTFGSTNAQTTALSRSATGPDTYSCHYSTGGSRTIQFGGSAIEYNTANTDQSAIHFTTPEQVSSVWGDLSAIFGIRGAESYSKPKFLSTFKDCVNLTTVPNTLFQSLTVGGIGMFNATFKGCTGLTSIPYDLFNFSTPGFSNMFSSTFEGCTGLQTVDYRLFSHITSEAQYLFWHTFKDAGLTSIPYNLFYFNGNVNGANNMFESTFEGCSGLMDIPGALFTHISSPQSSMFKKTFKGCTSLTSIPNNLFQPINFGANNMFESTFEGCTGLKYLPGNLFSGIISVSEGMFKSTFKGCNGLNGNNNSTLNFIPTTLFSGLINESNPSQSPYTTDMMASIFQNTSLRTCCPAGYEQYITGYENYWDSHVSCVPCQSGYTSDECGACHEIPNEPENYTVNYSCTNGQYNGTQTLPEGTTVNVPLNTVSCTAPTGYEFAGWYCSHGHTSLALSNVTPAVSVSGVDTNSVYVHEHFDCSGTTCSFELSADTECIALWRNISPCENGGHSAQYILGTPASESTINFSTNVTTVYGTYDIFNYGTVYVEGMCSTTSGVFPFAGTPSSGGTSRGQNCWCHVTGFTPTGGTLTTLNDMPYVYIENSENCSSNCTAHCSEMFGVYSSLRESLYSSYSCQYNVTYYCNANAVGSRPNTTEPYLPGVTVDTSGHDNCVVETGYAVDGWMCYYVDDNNVTQNLNYSPSGHGVVQTINSDTFTMPSSNVTCIAQLECATGYEWNSNHTACVLSTTYSVSFAPGDSNNNGSGTSATGNMSDISNKHAGDTITLPSNGFTAPSGYVFNGWSCDNGIGTQAVNSTFNMPSNNVTCTAQWVQSASNEYAIRYTVNAPNGATVTNAPNPASVSVTSGTNYTLASAPSASGYTFLGWRCTYDINLVYYGLCMDSNNNVISCAAGTTITMPASSVSCLGQWTQNYKIKYIYRAPDGDTVTNVPNPDTVSVGAGTTYALATAPIATKHIFTGWDCVYNNSDSVCINSNHDPINCGSGESIIMPSANVTCTAQWDDISCPNGGNPVQYILGMPSSHFDPNWWDENGDAGGQETINFTSYGNIKLKARCSTDSGVVGVAGNPSESHGTYCWCQVVSYSGNDELASHNLPWIYFGYFGSTSYAQCMAGGDAGCIKNCSSLTSAMSSYRHALYTTNECQYNVTYNCGQNSSYTGSGSNQWIVSSGNNVNTSSASCSAKSGYNFTGWDCSYVDANSNTQSLNGSSFTMPSYNVSCQAVFQPKSYTITYNCENDIAAQQGLLDTSSTHSPNTAHWYGDWVTLWAENQNGTAVGSCTVPEHKVFVGWSCEFPNGSMPHGVCTDSSCWYQSSVHLYNTDEYGDPCDSASCDTICGNVVCTAAWKCAEGYHWDDLTQSCIDGYRVYYFPGQHGINTDGNNATGFGPGVNLGGGTPGQNWSTKSLSEAHIVAEDSCYEFCGWSNYSPNDTCGSNYIYAASTNQGEWTFNYTLNLYAIWRCASGCVSNGNGQCAAPSNYDLTYNVNAPSGVTVTNQPSQLTVSVAAGTSYTLASAPTATGYTFNGWSCKDANNNSICTDSNNNAVNCGAPSSITMPESNVICTGQWDCATNYDWSNGVCVPNTYNITYHNVEDATWASVNDNPSTYTYGVGATIGVPSRQNYVFAGWCVNSSSCWGYSNNINGYTIGQNATGDYNLYARWDNVYQVSYFIGNCGAPSNGTQNYTNTSVRANDTAVFGQSYDVQLPTSSQLQLVGDTALNHYIDGLENCVQFLGYYDGYAPGGDFSVDYPCSGSSCGSFYPNSTYHGMVASDGSLPLYMRCNWVTYPVVYHSCDGSETFEDTGTVYSSSFSIKNYTATGLTLPSGYVFKGWSETANSATAEYPYYSNNSYTMNSCEQSGYKIHLYAVCKLNNFTLTYNVNAKSGVTVGNQPDPLSVTVTAGTSYTLASAPTATGYTFKGWSCKDQYSQSICTDSNNTAINCAASSSITMPESDVICAGQWDVNTITLLWLPDGGTPNPITTPDSCTYGMSNGITGIAQPQKPGYSFAGWEVTNWQ